MCHYHLIISIALNLNNDWSHVYTAYVQAKALKNRFDCFAGGPQLSKAVETKEFFSSFGVKKFRKFLTFLYCFTSPKQHITIGQEFLLLF